MKVSKFISALLILLAVMLATVSVLLCFFAMGQKPMILSEPKQASSAAARVMDAVRQGDFAEAGKHLQGSPDLGVDREPENVVGKILWEEFLRTFRYEFQGSCYAVETGMALDVSVTYLDFDSVISTLGDRTGEMLRERVKNAEDPGEVYDADNNYREDLVNEVLEKAARDAVAEDSRMVTEDLTLYMVYEGDQWWVVPDSALIRVISGGTAG